MLRILLSWIFHLLALHWTWARDSGRDGKNVVFERSFTRNWGMKSYFRLSFVLHARKVVSWVVLRSLTKVLSKLLTTTCRGNEAFTMSSLFMRCNWKPPASKDFLAAYEVFVTLQVFILKKNSRTELTVVLAEQLYYCDFCRRREDFRGAGYNCHDVAWRLYSVSWCRRNWMTLGSFSGRGRTRGWVTTNINNSSTRL